MDLHHGAYNMFLYVHKNISFDTLADERLLYSKLLSPLNMALRRGTLATRPYFMVRCSYRRSSEGKEGKPWCGQKLKGFGM